MYREREEEKAGGVMEGEREGREISHILISKRRCLWLGML